MQRVLLCNLLIIDINLVTVVALYKSLETYLEYIRNKFDFCLEQAKKMSSEQFFS